VAEGAGVEGQVVGGGHTLTRRYLVVHLLVVHLAPLLEHALLGRLWVLFTESKVGADAAQSEQTECIWGGLGALAAALGGGGGELLGVDGSCCAAAAAAGRGTSSESSSSSGPCEVTGERHGDGGTERRFIGWWV